MTTYSYPLEFYDVEISTSIENNVGYPLTVGGNFTPGDLRVGVIYAMFTADTPGNATTIGASFGPWTINGSFVYTPAGNNYAIGIWAISLPLTQTSADFSEFITLGTNTLSNWGSIFFTVRKHNASFSGTNFHAGFNADEAGDTTAPISSMTVPAVGTAIYAGFAAAQGLVTPTGYTPIFDSGNSGANYSNLSTDAGALLAGISFPTGSGTTAPTSKAANPTTLAGCTLFFGATPDVSTALTVATAEVDTANAVTAANQSLVTSFLNAATPEVDLAFPVFTPLYGDSLSQPILLPGLPVTASKVSWSATTYAAGSDVFVHTSINNGATFQRCTNGGAIPNLLPGNTTAKTVLTKVIAVRAAVTDPTPQVAWLKADMSFDSYNDELVSLGVFLIDEVDITVTGGTTGGSGGSSGGGDGVTGTGGGNTGGGLSISITGTDLSLGVARNAWNDVFFIPYNTNRADAIREIIDNRFPGLTYNFASTVETTTQLVFGTAQGNDPWQDAMDLAAAIGYEVFFDANGVVTFRPAPDPSKGTPVWEFNDGMKPTVVSVQRTLNDQTTYNYVVVTGVSTSNSVPVSAVAYDDDPNSPTYIHGSYGVKSYYFQSAAITTTTQAQAAADALLRQVLGACDTTVLTNVPMAALEPGDIVSVNITEAKASGNYLLNAITTPLSGAEAQQSTVYRQSTS
jgi:hypothetical protein